MGGRGSISFTGYETRSRGNFNFERKPVARLNRGNAGGGASEEQSVERFRQQFRDEEYEYSVYMDKYGYMHGLGTSHNPHTTKVTPRKYIKTTDEPKSMLHNHPGDKQTGYGGTFSFADMSFLGSSYGTSKGVVNTIYATSPEGTYRAVIKGRRAPSQKEIRGAYNRAKKLTTDKKYRSYKGMWEAAHNNLSDEMKKIGIEMSFNRDTSFKPRKRK